MTLVVSHQVFFPWLVRARQPAVSEKHTIAGRKSSGSATCPSRCDKRGQLDGFTEHVVARPSQPHGSLTQPLNDR
jgi:hypothetical protein